MMGTKEPTILVVDEVGSTNTALMHRLARGMIEPSDLPLWLRAEIQTAGRGRQGRAWVSRSGNLTASYAVALTAPPETAHQLSMVAGIAVYDCVSELLGNASATPRLKWPNDVMVDGAKISGILCETMALPYGQGRAAVLGIGINLAHHPEDLARPTTSIAQLTGVTINPAQALDVLSRVIQRWLEVWSDGAGFANIRTQWLAAGHRHGEPLTVHLNTPKESLSGPLAGHFAGLDVDGALLLKGTDGKVLRITFGDVSLA